MTKQILIVAAHADDEALGCGGTIAKHVANGDRVHVVFMADGVGSRGGDVTEAIQEREVAMKAAAKILGITSTTSLGFPDNRMDSITLLDVVQSLEKVILKVKPETVYTHHFGDLNIDHRITHQAVMTACRPLPGCSIKEILTFEVISSTEWQTPNLAPFVPNTYIDIGKFFEQKLAAIEAYEHEMRTAPHSRSLRHVEVLASHHGLSVGMEYAESFCVVRSIK
jgi:N-acetylglucosamine malate deacetylase 1